MKHWKFYPSKSLKHSKFYSFMKTISLKQKRHVLRTFQFLAKIAVSGGWPFFLLILGFFEMLKIPFQFVWNIQNFILSWKQSVWSKNGMFWVLLKIDFSIFAKIAVSGPFRRGHFLVDFRIFWNVENTLPIRLKHSKLYSFMKTISLKQKRHVLRTFQFWPKSLYPDVTGVAIFWLILGFFEMFENTLPIRLKHSKFYSFMKTSSLKQKRHVLRTFQFWPKSLYPDVSGVAIFFGWF